MNLKRSVAVSFFLLIVAPFVYFRFKSADAFDHVVKGYDAVEIGVFLGIILTFFGLIAIWPAFARLCARDPQRIGETVEKAKVSTVLAMVCVILWLVAFLFR